MLKISTSTKVIMLLLGMEVIRECITLHAMGFQPGRFVDWLKGSEDVTR